MMNKPQLSVIIASYNSKKTIGDCLLSLQNQTCNKDFEVIVVDSSTDGTAEIVAERFPGVELIGFPERKHAGSARNAGIERSRGDIIALIDADCTADGSWVDEILKAHRSEHLAIGGVIDNANPGSLVGWASYFCEFTRWMPGTARGMLKDIAGANMSYKKKVFDEYGGFLEGTYCSDTELHWRLARDGRPLRFVPAIRAYHRNIEGFGEFIRHEYYHGWCFARVRTRFDNFSALKRYFYASCFPFLAAKILLTSAFINLGNRRYLWQFLKSLPLLAPGIVSWSLGECVGYAGGDRTKSA